jgi:hypothetical protein
MEGEFVYSYGTRLDKADFVQYCDPIPGVPRAYYWSMI